ncbi:Hypothetical_protein [Hexamita inflata]|uniref:Hypothetical_protein n=1 Tax=Hexamita inflata TaxID=28002 RepID=A0AA86RUQ5_9EUKA|nr:Hypothetical protein HINF_LOCUS60565 [Hexamita inflata]
MQQIRNIHKQNNPNYEQRFVSRGHAVYAKAYQNPMINDYTNLLILKRIDLFTGSKLPVQTMSVLIYDHFHDVCDLNQLYLENNAKYKQVTLNAFFVIQFATCQTKKQLKICMKLCMLLKKSFKSQESSQSFAAGLQIQWLKLIVIKQKASQLYLTDMCLTMVQFIGFNDCMQTTILIYLNTMQFIIQISKQHIKNNIFR